MARFVIALGSNLGNHRESFALACAELEQHGIKILKMSSIIQTSPVDCPPKTPDFHNAALLATKENLDPFALLEILQKIEEKAGRPRKHAPNSSRTLDLDIIWFNNLQIDTPTLTLPHPRAKLRDFVLIPLREIAPELEKSL